MPLIKVGKNVYSNDDGEIKKISEKTFNETLERQLIDNVDGLTGGITTGGLGAFVHNEKFKKRNKEIAEQNKEKLSNLPDAVKGSWNDEDTPTTATETVMNHRMDAERYMLRERIKDNLKHAKNVSRIILNEEENKMMENYWSLYEVVAVDKEGMDIDPDINKKVIAKNEEHAKGLAGVNRLLENYHYDNTKLAVRVTKIMDIKPVEEGE